MGEKIAFTSWNFIVLRCARHNAEMCLSERNGRVYYTCSHTGCSFSIPVLVYEKILDDTVKQVNSGKLIVGSSWRKRYCGKLYSCKIEEAPNGKCPVIAIAEVCQ